jgi:D-hydroxyproline dehydrogenase subunit beta
MSDHSADLRVSRIQDVGVVGAGIVGLAHARSAARRGHRVTVFERTAPASGASVRNFGMIWPIGQPAGEAHALALRSRQAWLELARDAGLWVHSCGSIHLAHRDDEWAVLEEFASVAPGLGYSVELLSRADVLRRTEAANPEGLLGGLLSSTELAVNPRTAVRALPGWLASHLDVRFEPGTTITNVEPGRVRSADGRTWAFDRIIICSGADFETLFPELFRDSGLVRCKLQMLKTVSQPRGWTMGPHLASGLTLRHYANFAVSASLPVLKRRIAAETPELDLYGIHVMASQNDVGEVILGDSHEYESAIEPFDKAVIDSLILRELARVIRLPSWELAERWHGVYGKHGTRPLFEAQPLPDVHVQTGTGGAGMTMSFGLSEKFWETLS